jgi:hypothetical protein
MSRQTLEKRVASLEAEVAKLREALRTAGDRPAKDWRRSVGIFTNDPGMKEIFAEAMRLREADRKKTRPKPTSRRRSGR